MGVIAGTVFGVSVFVVLVVNCGSFGFPYLVFLCVFVLCFVLWFGIVGFCYVYC